MADNEAPVELRPLWGEPIHGMLQGIEEDDDALYVEIVVSGRTFARVVATESFGLMDEALAVGSPEQLDPEAPVRMTLRLRRGLTAHIAAQEDELAVAVAHGLCLPDEPWSSVVRQSEAWLLCAAMQRMEVPGDPEAMAEAGIRTAWMPDDDD